MKHSNNVDHYKEKIIELADKLLEKEKECSHLSALSNIHEMRIESLEKQLVELESYSKSLDKFILEKQLQINGLEHQVSELVDRCIHAEKQRDNYKNDYDYVEECFQAEREARYKLEDEIKVLKGQKSYPCISLECNDITGESSSLYFCFSYDEKVLLANNVPKDINKNMFEIHISVDRLGLTYHISNPSYFDEKGNPYIYFKILHDTKQLIDYNRPLVWMNYCNNRSNRDIIRKLVLINNKEEKNRNKFIEEVLNENN